MDVVVLVFEETKAMRAKCGKLLPRRTVENRRLSEGGGCNISTYKGGYVEICSIQPPVPRLLA